MAQDIVTAEDLDARCNRFLDRAERIRNQHVIAAVTELGEAAVEELYDGDMERAHERGPAQDEPLLVLTKRFAARMGFIGLTVDQVRTAIRAYDIDRQLPPVSRGCLLPTQLRALAVIPSPSDRALLANQAVAEEWTVEQIQQQVADYRRRSGLKGKGGRPPTPVPLKLVQAAARGLDKLGEPAALAGLSDQAREAMRQEMVRVKASAEAWLAKL